MNTYIKNKIKRCFNKVHATYDDHCQAQVCAANVLINQLKNYRIHYYRALDIGCGTGITTKILMNAFHFDHIQGLDFASELLIIAKNRLKNSVELIEVDFDEFHQEEKTYDLIFSNMSLQWSRDLMTCINKIYQLLSHDGIFTFSIPLAGTFQELQPAHVNPLHHQEEILKIVHSSGLNVLESINQTHVRSFDTINEALWSIKVIGANSITNRNKTFINKTGINYFFKKLHPPYSLTYQLGCFIAIRD